MSLLRRESIGIGNAICRYIRRVSFYAFRPGSHHVGD